MIFLRSVLFFFACSYVNVNCQSEGFIEIFKWKQLEYKLPGNQTEFNFPDTATSQAERNVRIDYNAYNNVPVGVSHYKGRLFITVPRRNLGIPATLSTILTKASKATKSPPLKAYPDYATNELHSPPHADSERLISVYRTRVDECNRLWFIDTGMLEYRNNRRQVQRPSIWIMDLETNKRIRRFQLPVSVVEEGRGIASITVDVSNNSCDNAFGYIPDLLYNAMYVYSFRENKIWTFRHPSMHMDATWEHLSIGGQEFDWDDSIFSITLGNRNPDGYRTAYYHPMISVNEFAVSTEVLQNEANSLRQDHGDDFKDLGSRGPSKQTAMHDFDRTTGVIFYSEVVQHGVGCWNTNKPFSENNHGIIQRNESTMIYPGDLTVDQEGSIWVMTNSMPVFIYSELNPDEYNFRVWTQKADKAIANTVCQL